MDYRITHVTQYIYQDSVSLCYNEARLTPPSFEHSMFTQTCLKHTLAVDPPWSDHRTRTDFFGNQVLYFTLLQPHQQTIITATSEVRIMPTQTVPAASSPWEEARRLLHTELNSELLDARQFAMSSPMTPLFPDLIAYAAPSFPPQRPLLAAVTDLMERIYQDFIFTPGATTIATPLSEVLRNSQGVCQDFAHLMVGCLRSQGLAARYVSGYIETVPPPGQAKLKGTDASHAWCAVYIPELGWLDFDPTNNLLPTDQHITLAWGRDYADVTPLKGVLFTNGEHQLQVFVDVERIPPEQS
jgi:transglutaminase-like putative cysteine protease